MSIKKATDIEWDSDDRIVFEKGETFDVFIFYHNNAPVDTNAAINTRIWADFPALIKAKTSEKGIANISSDNAIPLLIWSTLTFSATADTLLRYKQGSAFIRYADGTEKYLPSEGKDLFNEPGQLVGQNLDGLVPGCDVNSAFIQFQIITDQPDFTISMQTRVNNDGTAISGWLDSMPISAVPEYGPVEIINEETGEKNHILLLSTPKH